MDIIVELHCDKCGSANLSLPPVDDGRAVACNDCGEEHGTIAELREELLACAFRQSAEVQRAALERG